MTKTSAAKIAANNRYNEKAYDQLGLRVAKKERIIERVHIGAEKAGVSSRAYIIDAIRARLDADGIPTADALPTVDSSEDGSTGSTADPIMSEDSAARIGTGAAGSEDDSTGPTD